MAAGDNVVDCYDAAGLMYPGGNCLNVAVFARRFGARTGYIGRVGADAAGRHLVASLETEGVDIRGVGVMDGGDTAHCVIGHVDGDRVFLSSAKGVSEFEPTACDLELIAAADAVHVGATSGLDAFIPAFGGLTRVSYDFAIFRDAEHIERIAPHTFLATFSGGSLDDVDASALADRALDAGAAYALVTRGERGALLATRGERWTTPAAPATVVDTLGAGDTFVACVLVGLLRGDDVDELLAAAARAAAETCAAAGAFGHGIPIALSARALEAGRPVVVDPERAPSVAAELGVSSASASPSPPSPSPSPRFPQPHTASAASASPITQIKEHTP